jgi:hypothetical protein
MDPVKALPNLYVSSSAKYQELSRKKFKRILPFHLPDAM